MGPTRQRLVIVAAAVASIESALVRLGRTYGSSRAERVARLPGDDVIDAPDVQTDHAVTIDAAPCDVWPWLVQMGWGRGDFVPDGAPETGCGFHVVRLEPPRSLVLRSTSHLPSRWRDQATLDWTWAFALSPLDGGRRTRLHVRSRWATQPWWLTLGSWLVVVPADLVMGRDMLHGVRRRSELLGHATTRGRRTTPTPTSRQVTPR